MKYLLLFGVLWFAWWLWRKDQAGQRPPAPPPARPAERMVACAHCGVHLPQGEALTDGDRHFCCEEHRRAAGGL